MSTIFSDSDLWFLPLDEDELVSVLAGSAPRRDESFQAVDKMMEQLVDDPESLA